MNNNREEEKRQGGGGKKERKRKSKKKKKSFRDTVELSATGGNKWEERGWKERGMRRGEEEGAITRAGITRETSAGWDGLKE